MNENPKSFWKKSWNGPRAFLFWLLIVTIAAFLAAVLLAMVAEISTPLFGLHPGLEHLVGFFLEITLGFIVAVAVIFALYGFVRWGLRWRNFKKFLFACACLITMIALFYAEEDWRGKHDWDKYKNEWEAKGERFDVQSVVPPPVPDDENFALAPIWVESMKAVLGPKNSAQWFGTHYAENGRTNFSNRLALSLEHGNDWQDEPTNGYWARGTVTDIAAWQAYFRAPIQTNKNSTAATNAFPIAPQPQTPAQDVLLALSKYDSAIEELREASHRPYSRFPVNYGLEQPFNILLPHLAALKRATQP